MYQAGQAIFMMLSVLSNTEIKRTYYFPAGTDLRIGRSAKPFPNTDGKTIIKGISLENKKEGNIGTINSGSPFYPIVYGWLNSTGGFETTKTYSISSLTRVGSVATAILTEDHKVIAGFTIVILGADQAEYNGYQFITGTPASNSITYNVTGTPVTPATGTIVAITANFSEIDPDHYQDGTDTLATVPDGKYTVQWVYSYRLAAVAVYSTLVYDSMHFAIEGYKNQALLPIGVEALKGAIKFGYLIVKKGTTDLSNPDDALFIDAEVPVGVATVNNINRGVISDFNTTDEGDLNIAWIAAKIYYQLEYQPLDIEGSAGSIGVANNAINYLQYINGTTLTINTTKPEDPEVLVSTICAQSGDIVSILSESTLTERLIGLLDGTSDMLPVIVLGTGSLLVEEDTDVTYGLDLKMSAGTLIFNGHIKKSVSQSFSRIDNLRRYYADSGVSGGWGYLDAPTIDTIQFDNGIDLEAIPANKWVKGVIGCMQNKMFFRYPDAWYDNTAAAIAAPLPLTPPGLIRCPSLMAIVYQQGATTLPIPGEQWIDLREFVGTAIGAGGITSFFELTDTPSGVTANNTIYKTNLTTSSVAESTTQLIEADTNKFEFIRGTADLEVTNQGLRFPQSSIIKLLGGGPPGIPFAKVDITSTFSSTYFGQLALANETASLTRNTAFGNFASYSLTIGSACTSLGYQAGYSIVDGTQCTCVGENSDIYDGAPNDVIQQTALGHGAICWGDYSCQLNSSSLSPTKIGVLRFRTQRICRESWIDTNDYFSYIDATGNIIKGDQQLLTTSDVTFNEGLFNGRCESQAFRAANNLTFPSGEGLEMQYSDTLHQGFIGSYNRSTSSFQRTNFFGSNFGFRINSFNTDAMTLTAAGLGIGITPTEVLHLNKSATQNYKLMFSEANINQFSLYYYGGSAPNKFHIRNEAGTPANLMTFLQDGKVGVGIDPPTALFHIGGNTRIDGNLGVGIAVPTQRIEVNGNILAHSVFWGERSAPTLDLNQGMVWQDAVSGDLKWSANHGGQTKTYTLQTF
jgi:hypothetical protein